MLTRIRKNEVGEDNFLKSYEKEVKKVSTFKKDVQELSELMAKHETDIYVVADFKRGQDIPEMEQGDILLWKEGCRMYDKYIDTLEDLEITESRNLQLGESITGDHCVVPLKGSNLTIKNGSITIKREGSRDLSYPVKMIETDKPFCLVHKEHGNMTLPAGTYMSCVSLNPKTMTRMLD